MKLSIVSSAALALTVAAVPHLANRRDAQAAQTVTAVVTQTAAAAMVAVNQDGTPQYTQYNRAHGHGRKHRHGKGRGKNHPTTKQTTIQTTIVSEQPEPSASGEATTTTSLASEGSYAPPAPTESTDAPAPSGDATQSASPSASPSESASGYSAAPAPSSPAGGSPSASGQGLSYAPYNSDDSCKTADQIDQDLGAFSGHGFVRIYGTACEQVPAVIKAATANNMKVMVGVFDIANVEGEINDIVAAAKGNWDVITAVSVGNEIVNSGSGSASSVVAAVNTARGLLKTAGYTGSVVTVDTFAAIIDNPELCEASDFAAANCHAFFDNTVTADEAGPYVAEQAQRVKEACGGKEVMITETGWPSSGDPNGKAVPSPENQKAAISSLKSSFGDNIVLFSAYNDAWKDDFEGSIQAEKFWGIYGDAPSS
ncbi:Cell surface mannoprotein mp65 [Vermiconidia calcicola]|uniref:Cell surface mannoprotein mp65 n=1 Tax=Vermiconidia calcicola TaxID=1690605 RepID=A0ACC3NLL6_9PEZI|nr:Cell surface mannoprotein mp65 [Vermiconidia calcicola]